MDPEQAVSQPARPDWLGPETQQAPAASPTVQTPEQPSAAADPSGRPAWLDTTEPPPQPRSELGAQTATRSPFNAMPAGSESLPPEQYGEAAAKTLSPGWGYEEALTTGAARAITGDLTSRLDAGVHSAIAGLTGGDRQQAYQDRLAQDEAYVRALQQQFPSTSLGGQILGLIGLGFAMPSGPTGTMLADTWGGRIAWQSMIGGGLGALMGATQPGSDRLAAAKSDAIVGAGLGAAAGGFGELLGLGVNALFGKPLSKEVKTAINASGMKPIPGHEQPEAVRSAIERVTGKLTPNTESENVMPSAASEALEEPAQKAWSLKDQALQALQRSGSREAQLSADAVGSVGRDIARDLESPERGLDRINLAYIQSGSPGGQAINVLETLQKRAAASPNGQVSFREMTDAYRAINRFYQEGDHVVPAVQRAFKRWMANAFDSQLMSGPESGIAQQEWLEFSNLYGQYKDLVDPKNTFGNVLNRYMNGDHAVNWIGNITNLGGGDKAADLVASIRSYVGENTPKWNNLRSLVTSRLMNLEPGPLEAGNQVQIERGLERLLKSPVARQMYNEQDIAKLQQAAFVLRSLPKEAPLVVRAIMDWKETLLGAAAGSVWGGLGGEEKSLPNAVWGALGGILAAKTARVVVPRVGPLIAPVTQGATRAAVPGATQAVQQTPSLQFLRPMASPMDASATGRRDGGLVRRVAVNRAHALASRP